LEATEIQNSIHTLVHLLVSSSMDASYLSSLSEETSSCLLSIWDEIGLREEDKREKLRELAGKVAAVYGEDIRQQQQELENSSKLLKDNKKAVQSLRQALEIQLSKQQVRFLLLLLVQCSAGKAFDLERSTHCT
jgi:hypothetical protein